MIDTGRTYGTVRDIRTHNTHTHILKPDLESFVRGGPTLTIFFGGREDLNTTISGQSSARQRNAN